MAQEDRPPLLAAAAGGFIGAVVGVFAAGAMMGDNGGNKQAAVEPAPIEQAAELVAKE